MKYKSLKELLILGVGALIPYLLICGTVIGIAWLGLQSLDKAIVETNILCSFIAIVYVLSIIYVWWIWGVFNDTPYAAKIAFGAVSPLITFSDLIMKGTELIHQIPAWRHKAAVARGKRSSK